MTKYIFFTGGVVSSIGKGLTAASLGMLLKSRGLKVGIQKLDPYFNPDPSTLNPLQHGEIFVTDDGTEADLALGHYERIMDISLTSNSATTLGKIYRLVLDKERNGFYGGNTVQVIPHITNEVKDVILNGLDQKDLDVIIVEIGGTVGDIESLAFLETIRQIRQDLGKENTLFIHIALVPYLHMAGEAKTKPVQHSVKHLRGIGIQPDIIVCRLEQPLEEANKEKISLFCDIDKNAVIEHVDTDNLYEIPLSLAQQGLDQIVVDKLKLKCKPLNIDSWAEIYHKSISANIPLTIGVIGKYTDLPDSYLSVLSALRHSAIEQDVALEVRLIDAETLTKENIAQNLQGVSGILIPDGFGIRGCEGMLLAANYGRVHDLPFLGIGMGMHIALVEFAREVCGIPALMPESEEQDEIMLFTGCSAGGQEGELGGTLTVGLAECRIVQNTKLHGAYAADTVWERHRYRYIFNPDYQSKLADHGLIFSCTDAKGQIIEGVELANHPWFVACQFRPEFKSRPGKSSPLLFEFVKQSLLFSRK